MTVTPVAKAARVLRSSRGSTVAAGPTELVAGMAVIPKVSGEHGREAAGNGRVRPAAQQALGGAEFTARQQSSDARAGDGFSWRAERVRKYLHIEIARQQLQVARSPGAETEVGADENGLRTEPEQIGETPARLLRRMRRAERNDHRLIDAQHRETPQFLVDRRENGGPGEVRFRRRVEG